VNEQIGLGHVLTPCQQAQIEKEEELFIRFKFGCRHISNCIYGLVSVDWIASFEAVVNGFDVAEALALLLFLWQVLFQVLVERVGGFGLLVDFVGIPFYFVGRFE